MRLERRMRHMGLKTPEMKYAHNNFLMIREEQIIERRGSGE